MSQKIQSALALLMTALLLSLASASAWASETYPTKPFQVAASEGSYDDFYALLDEEEDLPESLGFPDPIENVNRKTLRFNQRANKWLFNPVSRGYAYLVPNPVRLALRRFFKNLNAPVTLVNDMLQLEWKDAAITTGALLVNSTIGLGGLFAPGEKIGLPRHRSDFGQTLALANIESGPYLIIPVMGPTNVRDGAGTIVDLFMRPASWFLGFGAISILSGTGEGIVILETHHKDLEELEKSSVDFYPVLRSAYYQTRIDEIWKRRQHRKK